MSCTRHSARRNRPTVTSSTTAAATSPTTKSRAQALGAPGAEHAGAVRAVRRPRASAADAPRRHQAEADAGGDAWPAAATAEHAEVGRRRLRDRQRRRHERGGDAGTIHHGQRRTPTAPPTVDSTRLSVSTWRASRRGRAPIASRTASSRWRGHRAGQQQAGQVGAGDEQHAAEAPTSASSIVRDCRVTSSRSQITVAPVRSLACGYARASPSATAPSSARAWSIVTPGARRPTAWKYTLVRSASPRARPAAASTGRPCAVGNSNHGGITPTTTYGGAAQRQRRAQHVGRAAERRPPQADRSARPAGVAASRRRRPSACGPSPRRRRASRTGRRDGGGGQPLRAAARHRVHRVVVNAAIDVNERDCARQSS